MISRTDGCEGANAPQDIDTASAHAGAATGCESSSLLPEPESLAGDPATMVAKLFVKSAQQKRAGDDVSLRMQEAAEDAADAKRMQAMRDKASANLYAGIASGVSQCASGILTGVAGFTSAAKIGKGDGASLANARSVGNIWESAAQVSGGTGKLFEAGWKSEADRFDRKIADAESGTKLSKRAQDALRREIDAGTQHEGKVMQLLQEIKQAQAQCERAALLRM